MTECLAVINNYGPGNPREEVLINRGNPMDRRLGTGRIKVEHAKGHFLDGDIVYRYRTKRSDPITIGTLRRGERITILVSQDPPISVDLYHRLTNTSHLKR